MSENPGNESAEESPRPRRRWLKWLLAVIGLFLAVYLVVIGRQLTKPLPDGISMKGPIHRLEESSIEFLYDLTYENEDDEIVAEQTIFDRIFQMIDQAEEYILLDMFLFDTQEDPFRDLSNELVDKLIQKKNQNPDLRFQIMTDLYNTFYNSFENEPLARLEEAGIPVGFSDMDRLRDSNFLYSGVWRMFFQPFGLPSAPSDDGWFEVDGEPCSIRSVLKALNCKANHRKVLVVDCGEITRSIVTSANPSAYGSKYSNVALYFEETSPGIHNDIYESERAIASYSRMKFTEHEFEGVAGERVEDGTGGIEARFVTEGKIRKGLLEEFDSLGEGDSISITMFLLTEREVIDSLVSASERGVDIRIVIDPSKYLFGQDSKGVPNRPAMSELHDRTEGKIRVRWYNTHGEEFHSKMAVIHHSNGKAVVFLGSSNLTRRNIGDFNLEADVQLISDGESEIIRQINAYFERIWENKEGECTLDYDELKDDSGFRYLKYRVQEQTGLCAW
ncbi:MAG: hypothetical protein KC944_13880 [Candidatus Omnitrophica bacterium]|nr:hypothetical protein [Candidatus Omnitrophota bacterium]